MTLLRIIDRKAKDPISLPTTDEIEGSFSRVPAIASLMAVDQLRAALTEQRPLLVGVADVYVRPVIQRELERETPAELAGAQPAFMPVVNKHPLALTATDTVAGFDHPDVVIRYADVNRPIYANVAYHWGAILHIGTPARLVVAFDVDDLCLGVVLTQMIQPKGMFCYFSLEIVLPPGVTAMLRQGMEVSDVPR